VKNLDAEWLRLSEGGVAYDKRSFYLGAMMTHHLLREALKQGKNSQDAMCLLLQCMIEITECTDAFGYQAVDEIAKNLASDPDTAANMLYRVEFNELVRSLKKP